MYEQALRNHLAVYLILHLSIWMYLDTETLPKHKKNYYISNHGKIVTLENNNINIRIIKMIDI